jgi:hypothetical protein
MFKFGSLPAICTASLLLSAGFFQSCVLPSNEPGAEGGSTSGGSDSTAGSSDGGSMSGTGAVAGVSGAMAGAAGVLGSAGESDGGAAGALGGSAGTAGSIAGTGASGGGSAGALGGIGGAMGGTSGSAGGIAGSMVSFGGCSNYGGSNSHQLSRDRVRIHPHFADAHDQQSIERNQDLEGRPSGSVHLPRRPNGLFTCSGRSRDRHRDTAVHSSALAAKQFVPAHDRRTLDCRRRRLSDNHTVRTNRGSILLMTPANLNFGTVALNASATLHLTQSGDSSGRALSDNAAFSGAISMASWHEWTFTFSATIVGIQTATFTSKSIPYNRAPCTPDTFTATAFVPPDAAQPNPAQQPSSPRTSYL